MNSQQRCELERRCAEIEKELEALRRSATDPPDPTAAKRERELTRELDRLEIELAEEDQPRRRRVPVDD